MSLVLLKSHLRGLLQARFKLSACGLVLRQGVHQWGVSPAAGGDFMLLIYHICRTTLPDVLLKLIQKVDVDAQPEPQQALYSL